MIFKLSPSSLNLMEECSRCFWLDKHGVWKRPQGIFPSLPSGMDRILKKHFDYFRDKGELPPELSENGECDEMILFGGSDKGKELHELWRNSREGISWHDNDGNVLVGIIDNLFLKEKKFVVLDYKTRGFALKEDTHKHYQNQLDLYNFLLRKNGYLTEDFSFLLFYVPNHVNEEGNFVFDTTLVKMPVNIKNAENLFNKALKLLNGNCPETTCEWCKNLSY